MTLGSSRFSVAAAATVLLLLQLAPVWVLASERDFRSPIIGVLTMPVSEEYKPFEKNHGVSYLPASYVKWLESGGARVVPIHWDAPHDELVRISGQINGLLYTGGDDILNGTQYYHAAKLLLDLAIESNEEGDYFPVWGTCLGLEFLAVAATGTLDILTPHKASNVALPLDFVRELQGPAAAEGVQTSATSAPSAEGDPTSPADDAAESPATAAPPDALAREHMIPVRQSKLFSQAPPSVIDALAWTPVTINWHNWGVSPEDFAKHPGLSGFYSIVSTNLDNDGKVFISMIEGKRHPVYAVQWHPERNQFEWGREDEPLSRSVDSLAAVSYLASFFVDEARKNTHSFGSRQSELQALIQNHRPVFTAAHGSEFDFYEEVYFFSAFQPRDVSAQSSGTQQPPALVQ